MITKKKPRRKLVCTYTPPCLSPTEWAREPPADMLIGNSGRIAWGDFSIIFNGANNGIPFHIRPWTVQWQGATGTKGVGETHHTMRRFRRYRDAVRYAKNQEHARLDRLGAKK